MRALLCVFGHSPKSIERFATCVAFAYRCRDCGTTGISEGELLGIRDHVDPRRLTFERPDAA